MTNDDEIDEDSPEIDMIMTIGNTLDSLMKKYLHIWNNLTHDEQELVLVKASIMIATIVREKDNVSDDDRLIANPELDLEPTNRRRR